MRVVMRYVKENGATRGKIGQKGALRVPDIFQKLMVMAAYGPDIS